MWPFARINRYGRLFDQTSAKVLIVGFNDANLHSTFLRAFLVQPHYSKLTRTIPQLGLDVEELRVGKVTFQSMKLAHQASSSTVRLEDAYLRESDAVVFVIDCDDWSAITDVADIVRRFLRHGADDKYSSGGNDGVNTKPRPLLVMANRRRQADNEVSREKMKVEPTLSADQVSESLGLRRLDKSLYAYHVELICMEPSDGVYDGLKWLSWILKEETADK